MLKESDALIELIQRETAAEAAASGGAVGSALGAVLLRVQRMLNEHAAAPTDSALRAALLPATAAAVHVPLDLSAALSAYDRHGSLAARVHVPPSFREIRELLNVATVSALIPLVTLVCFDADDTLYSDGACLEPASGMIPVILRLLRMDVHVALVTAASYPGEPAKMEARIAALLRALALAIEAGAPPSLAARFHVMAGECNYLLRCDVKALPDGLCPAVRLVELPDQAWKDGRGVRWSAAQVTQLLDAAERALAAAAQALGLDVLLVRKPRAVGIVPRPPPHAAAVEEGGGAYRSGSGRRISFEVLEEVTLSVQAALAARGLRIPYTVFNGGADVFVDVGSKALGIRAVQALVGARPASTLHCGDRYTRTGNDLRARDVASTLWVTGPIETEYLVARLIAGMRAHRAQAVGGAACEAAGSGEQGHEEGACALAGGARLHLHRPPSLLPFTPPGTLASPPPHAPDGGEWFAPSSSHHDMHPLVGSTVSTPSVPGGDDGGGAVARDDLRTQWAAAGGEVVGEVRRHRDSPRR